MKIDETRIVERVMRMGIEHRAGTPVEDLYDLAVRQIKEDSKKVSISDTFDNIQHWWNEMQKNFGCAYAMMRNETNQLQCIRLSSADGLRIEQWASKTIPYVTKV